MDPSLFNLAYKSNSQEAMDFLIDNHYPIERINLNNLNSALISDILNKFNTVSDNRPNKEILWFSITDIRSRSKLEKFIKTAKIAKFQHVPKNSDDELEKKYFYDLNLSKPTYLTCYDTIENLTKAGIKIAPIPISMISAVAYNEFKLIDFILSNPYNPENTLQYKLNALVTAIKYNNLIVTNHLLTKSHLLLNQEIYLKNAENHKKLAIITSANLLKQIGACFQYDNYKEINKKSVIKADAININQEHGHYKELAKSIEIFYLMLEKTLDFSQTDSSHSLNNKNAFLNYTNKGDYYISKLFKNFPYELSFSKISLEESKTLHQHFHFATVFSNKNDTLDEEEQNLFSTEELADYVVLFLGEKNDVHLAINV
jgi:hypothetical protein